MVWLAAGASAVEQPIDEVVEAPDSREGDVGESHDWAGRAGLGDVAARICMGGTHARV